MISPKKKKAEGERWLEDYNPEQLEQLQLTETEIWEETQLSGFGYQQGIGDTNHTSSIIQDSIQLLTEMR